MLSGKLLDALLDAVYCPICGCKLHVDGEKLLCDRHGEMNAYLTRDPKAAKLDLGVEDLEAS